MGVISKRGNYWLDYRYEGRRYRKKVGPYKALAENAWAKIKTEMAENKFLDIKKTKLIRFGDFADRYYELHCKVNQRNPVSASSGLLKALKRWFADKYLHEITPMMIEKFKAERVTEVTASTVNRTLACLKSLYNKAISWKEFNGTNPVNEVRFLKEENHKLRYLEKEEILNLIQQAKGVYKPLITIAVFTGMRRGELLDLQWKNIDFNQGLIHLLKTKSGKQRVIPMNEFVRTALMGIHRHPKCPYVFVGPDGEPLKDVRRGYASALKAAGIENFRFHDLRHTFASQLAMGGVDLNTIRELLGHSDLKTTLIYAHLSKDHKFRAVKHLGSCIETALIPGPENQVISTRPESLESALVP